MKKNNLILSLLFSILSFSQNTINEFEYWFDNDYGNKVILSTGNVSVFSINANLDTSSLEDGIHTINGIAKDANGKLSVVLSDFFYKLTPTNVATSNIVGLEYWFDNDYSNKVVTATGNVSSFNFNTNLDISTLSSGIHTLNILTKDSNGKLSVVMSDFFYKLPANSSVTNPNVMAVEIWFDDDYTNVISNSLNPNLQVILNSNLSTTALSYGLHTANFRFQDGDGKWSSVLSEFFYKTPNNSVILKDIIAYEYWFNDDYANVTNIAIGPNQLENLNTYVIPQNAGLGIGNHYFNIRFKDSQGNWSSVLSEIFNLQTLESQTFETLANLVLYPNPSNGNLHIDLGKNYTSINIYCFDLNGKKVFETKKQNILNFDVNLDLPSGIYYLRIEADEEIANRKLLIR